MLALVLLNHLNWWGIADKNIIFQKKIIWWDWVTRIQLWGPFPTKSKHGCFLRFKEYQHIIFMYNCDLVENVVEENTDERLMKNLMDHCKEKLIDHLDDKKVFENNNKSVSHYSNLYAVCVDTGFNWLTFVINCLLFFKLVMLPLFISCSCSFKTCCFTSVICSFENYVSSRFAMLHFSFIWELCWFLVKTCYV